MKRTLAALTAVALAAGLSLAAVVAPAQADDTSTPAPAASTSPDTTPTSTPTSTPDPTPTTDPTPTADPTTDTTGSAPATASKPAAKSFGVASTTVNPYAPCISDSLVTYTYSNDDSNSGDITVPTIAGSSGFLCKSFYVTATSWKYTTNAVWPQVVDQVDHVNGTPTGTPPANIAISKSGVYHYAAQITCGQGDIYASWTATDATLFPENDNPGGTGYLAGPGNPLAEHFLHDMGFYGPNPTYRQDNTNCWTPTPETGVPTTSTLSCATGSSNTLTLPAVPGGVWTVTNGTGNTHYNHTYPIGTGVAGWVPTNFNGTYTITLADGNSADGYNVTGTSTQWTPQNPRTLDCNTLVTPVKPDVQSIVQCGVDGSITIPTTTGVNYYLGLNPTPLTPGQVITGSGIKLITALPQSGYEFSTNPHDPELKTWVIDLGSDKACDVTTVVGSCTADGSVSSVPVSLTLNNQSGSVTSSFVVKIEGTSFDQTFTVDAHSTKTVSIGTSTTAGETVDVFINGSTTAVVLTVDSFLGCVTVTPGDPTFTPLYCTGTTTNLGSISTDGNPALTYTLTGPGIVTPEVFPSLPATPTITGLVAGDYTVNVTANGGYVLSGAEHFPVTIPLLPVNCIGTQQTPVVTFVAPTCTPNPVNTNIKSAGFNAALVEVQGTITIPSNANMTFTISDGTTTTPITAGDYIEPDGTYTVVATLTPTAIADGYTFGPSADYTVSIDGKTATFKPIVFTTACGLPTLASWHSGAAGDPATCTANGALGTITVVHGSDLANPTDEDGKVTYTLVNNANNHTTNLGSTATSVTVAPGSYTVKAVPTDPADGLVGNPNVANEIDYQVTVAAPAGSCGDSLAFTGGTIAWFGFILAGGMLFLGIAFLLIRRRGDRTAE